MNNTTNPALHTIRRHLLTAIILLAPFSLIPSVSIESLGFAGLRIGLYQILVALFVACSIPNLLKYMPVVIRSKWGRIYLVGVILMLLVTFARSINTSRSLVMAGSATLLVLLTLSAWVYAKESAFRLESIARYMLYGGIFYALATLSQLAEATFTDGTNLLCIGCSSDVFGFARPNVFAVEPQFWANALLPTLFVGFASSYMYKSRLSLVSLFATSFAIGLTFSRGAFFAVAVTVVSLAGVLVTRKKFVLRKYVLTASVLVLGFVSALLVLIGSASIRYSDSPNIAYTTTRGMLEHLTLGVIDLPEIKQKEAISDITPIESKPVQETVESNFVSQGLVEASHEDRLGPADTALTIWTKNGLVNFVFGVGLGNFAPYVQKNITPESPLTLTVYIFYVLLVVEAGLLGLLLLGFAYLSVLKRLIRMHHFDSLAVTAIVIAFLVQYLFFGSYINVMYIWLWLGIGLGMQGEPAKRVASRW